MKFEDIECQKAKKDTYYFPSTLQYTYSIKKRITKVEKEEEIKTSKIMKEEDIIQLVRDNILESYSELDISFNSSNSFIVSENYIDCDYTMDNLEFFTNLGYEVVSILGAFSKRCVFKKKNVF